MWTWIICIVAVPSLHNLLLKAIWYRWLINSIIYPVNKLMIGRKYSKMNIDDRIWNWTKFETMDHWSKNYWFSKSISKHILLKYIDKGA